MALPMQLSPLDKAAYQQAASKKKPKPPAALPGNVRMAENQAAAKQANLANLPRQLSHEDRAAAMGRPPRQQPLPQPMTRDEQMAWVQRAAETAGTTSARTIAIGARQVGGPGGLADWAKTSLLRDVRNALLGSGATDPDDLLGNLGRALGMGAGLPGAIQGLRQRRNPWQLQQGVPEVPSTQLPASAYAMRTETGGPQPSTTVDAIIAATRAELAQRLIANAKGTRQQGSSRLGRLGATIVTRRDLDQLAGQAFIADPLQQFLGRAAASLRQRRTVTVNTLFDRAWREYQRQERYVNQA